MKSKAMYRTSYALRYRLKVALTDRLYRSYLPLLVFSGSDCDNQKGF